MAVFNKSSLAGSSSLASAGLAVIASCLLAANPASAQATPDTAKPQATDTDSEKTEQAIIVTGSRINQPNLQSANPITVLSGEQVFDRGTVNVGDQLNDLPQLRSTFSQQNGTRSLGTRGINLLDLRGLGTQRTLVLVNGRRHVAGDILVNGVSPDVNTIPADLVERIDVLTGGASAVYGSDAVAGVVNFILKDHYDGVQVRGQTGVSKYKDAGSAYISVLAGKNFADGRGNLALNLEFSHSQDYYASNRPNVQQNDNFVVVESDPTGSVNGSDGIPDRQFLRDIRSTTISTGGQLGFRYPRTLTPCGADYLGNAFTCAFLFQPDGTVTPETGTRVGLGPNGNFLGGNGYSGREGRLLALSPDLKRYSVNLVGHFEISPAFVPFIEAKYSRTVAFGSTSGPFFSQGTTLGDSLVVPGINDRSYDSNTGRVNREGLRLDNPYLSTQARTLISQQLSAAVNAGTNPNTGTTLSAANKATLLTEIGNGSIRFSLRRNYVDLGIRDEKITRETYRIVAGVRGDFNTDWKYELSFNYGEHRENNVIANNINRQRFLLANDTVRNPATGQIVCRSQLDPNYAGADRGGAPAVLAADIAACVPLNPFGDGSVSQAVKNYLTINSSAQGKITQFDVLGYVSGDTSGFFNLPGGPVAFSVGGEFRRETNFYVLDSLTQAGYAFYNAIPTFTAPSFEVKEAFGEIQVPLLKDKPFFNELTLKGNGRIANYKGSVGTVYAYGGEAIWRPIKDITLRGTYARSVRAPTLSDLYSQQSQNFAPAPNDPCAARNLATGSATRSANCDAAGRPAGYDYVYTASLEIVGGGNPRLKAETGDSITAGILLQPRFIPGLSISSDYYDIKVTNQIASIGSAQTILNLCYDSATLNNPFCGLFQRAGAAGGARGEQQFRVLEGSLLQSVANFAQFKARGIDTQVNYKHAFDFGKIDVNVIWTNVMRYESYTSPTDPTFVDVLVNELGNPRDQINANFAFKRGKVTIGYQMRYIGPMYLNTYEDYNGVNGLPPQNTDYAPIIKYPSVFYHDIKLSLDVTDALSLYLGVDNVTNRTPPYGLTGVGGGSGIYDVRGRYMYAGFRAKL